MGKHIQSANVAVLCALASHSVHMSVQANNPKDLTVPFASQLAISPVEKLPS